MTPDQVLVQLSGELAPSTLVTGPGAGLVVAGMAGAYGWTLWYDLSAADARQVREDAYLAPPSGLRVIALSLDGASARVQDMLLKVLEESPETTRFVLAATGLPLPTVTSRCRVLVLGAGEPELVSVAPADVAAVGTAIRAARARQPSLLYQVVRDWWKIAPPGEPPTPVRLLAGWAAQAARRRWQVFSPDLAPGVSPERAVWLLAELAKRPGSRLSAAVALETVFSQE